MRPSLARVSCRAHGPARTGCCATSAESRRAWWNSTRACLRRSSTTSARSSRPNRTQHLTKPLIAVVHGDTWNMAHELHLVADIRVASADVRFGQDENTHGRFPGGGATIRFPREAGWGNAMRYMLTGDHWGAQEAYRMGVIQQIAPNPAQALEAGIGLARKIAACGPLGIKTTLESAHLAIGESEAAAFAKLNEQFGGRFHTEDFTEGRKAEAEGRPPVYQGK